MSYRQKIGRSRETERLKELLSAPGPHLITVRGETGVGKTALLEEAAKERRLFRFEAADMNSRLLLRSFTSDFNQFFGKNEAEFPSWEDALKSVFEASLQTGSAIAFDRFEALCGAVPEFPAVLREVFQSVRTPSPCPLILSGGGVAWMRETVSGFKSPLYGLPNTTIELSGLSLRDMPAFFPGWTPADQFTVWALFGGVPGVLALFNREETLDTNLSRLLTRGSVFDFAVRLATETPFREPRIYHSIMSAVARDCDTPGKIAAWIGETEAKCGKYLSGLVRSGLVTKIFPCGVPKDGRKGLYRLSSPALKLWYRCLFMGSGNGASGLKTRLNAILGEPLALASSDALTRLGRRSKLRFMPEESGLLEGVQSDSGTLFALTDASKTDWLIGLASADPTPVGEAALRGFALHALKGRDDRRTDLAASSLAGYTDEARNFAETAGIRLLELPDLLR